MFRHLVAQHEMSTRQARFLSSKMVEWRRDSSTLMVTLRTMVGQQECGATGGHGFISASPRLTRDISSPASPLPV